ncbi:hypothetical protein QZH45_04710 [Pseudomonas corrugata]|uniref:hypothetical protein n=1 Tax=Pseudomonas corrugata TaxID=47879 RepID=UPI00083D4504|nr:hypothetical protein [Pseudomonas corrugata]AOE63761.1 hypothetical protein AXG94_19025 [Pseudomonas corrugata]
MHSKAPRPLIDRISIVLRPADGQTLEQIAPFIQLGAPVAIGRGLAVIAGASDQEVVTPSMGAQEFCIDGHVRMMANAKRYEWLRDRQIIEAPNTDILVIAGDSYFTGAELDKIVDDAMRLEVMEGAPCEQ